MTALWLLRVMVLAVALTLLAFLVPQFGAELAALPARDGLARFAAGADPEGLDLAATEAALSRSLETLSRADIHAERALVRVLTGSEPERAAEDLATALALAPELPQAWLRLALLDWSREAAEPGIDHAISRSLDLSPTQGRFRWSVLVAGLDAWPALDPPRRLAVAEGLRAAGAPGLEAIAAFVSGPAQQRRLRRIFRNDEAAQRLLRGAEAPRVQQVR